MLEEVKSKIGKVHRIRYSDDRLNSFKNELDFVDRGVEHLIELGSYICIAFNILPAGRETWSRNEAILGGNMVRLYKLFLAILDQTTQRRGELVMGFLRLAFETNVNIRFLIGNQSEDTFSSYVKHSLKFEKKLHNLVTAQIEQNHGEPLPIHRRILASIQRVFDKLGYSIDDIETKSLQNWASRNIFEKSQEVGLEEEYLLFFGSSSNFIHGNFMDLYEFHMRPVVGGYKAVPEFKRPRPQPILGIALVSCITVNDYYEYLENSNLIDGECVSLIRNRIRDLFENVLQVFRAHEEFLNR